MALRFEAYRVRVIRQVTAGESQVSFHPPQDEPGVSLIEAVDMREDFLRRGMGVRSAEIVPTKPVEQVATATA